MTEQIMTISCELGFKQRLYFLFSKNVFGLIHPLLDYGETQHVKLINRLVLLSPKKVIELKFLEVKE